MEEYITIYNRINELLESNMFELSTSFLFKVHGYIFNGIMDNAGCIRSTNIRKEEEILNGDSVMYSNYDNIMSYLKYDFGNEKKNDYSKLDMDSVIDNITDFTIRLWLTHPFREGNTRTISVFIRMYLKKMGYSVNNKLFLKYFTFYRNALVLASYETSYMYGTKEYLRLFYKKMIFDNSIDIDNIDIYHFDSVKKRIRFK